MTNRLKRLLVCLLTCLVLLQVPLQSALAQDAALPEAPMLSAGPRPPMQNIFYNVLWGSVAGGMGIMSISILDDSKTTAERYSFSSLSTQFITGATYGGIVGLVTGVYLSMSGIQFDSARTRIAAFEPYRPLQVETEQGIIASTPYDPTRVGLIGFSHKF